MGCRLVEAMAWSLLSRPIFSNHLAGHTACTGRGMQRIQGRVWLGQPREVAARPFCRLLPLRWGIVGLDLPVYVMSSKLG